jgi:hypothetical protein
LRCFRGTTPGRVSPGPVRKFPAREDCPGKFPCGFGADCARTFCATFGVMGCAATNPNMDDGLRGLMGSAMRMIRSLWILRY